MPYYALYNSAEVEEQPSPQAGRRGSRRASGAASPKKSQESSERPWRVRDVTWTNRRWARAKIRQDPPPEGDLEQIKAAARGEQPADPKDTEVVLEADAIWDLREFHMRREEGYVDLSPTAAAKRQSFSRAPARQGSDKGTPRAGSASPRSPRGSERAVVAPSLRDGVGALVTAIAKSLTARHSATVVLHGMARVGKTALCKELVPLLLDAARHSVDSAGRAYRQQEARKARLKEKEARIQEAKRQKEKQEKPTSGLIVTGADQAGLGKKPAGKKGWFGAPSKPAPQGQKRGSVSATSPSSPASRRPSARGSISTTASSLQSPHSPPASAKGLPGRQSSNRSTGRQPSVGFLGFESNGPLSPTPPAHPPGGQAPRGGGRPASEDSDACQAQEGSRPQPPARGQGKRGSVGGVLATELRGRQSSEIQRDTEQLIDEDGGDKPAQRGGRKLPSGRGGGEGSFLHFGGAGSYLHLPPVSGLPQCADHFMVDFWMQTSSTKRMALLDVQDGAGCCRFSINLNINTHDELVPNVVRFTLCDNIGKSVECSVEHDHLCDGEWHLVACHVVKAKENLVEARVDGRKVRCQIAANSDEPASFAAWEQYGVVGAEIPSHQLRDGAETKEIAHPFEGAICELRFWDTSFVPFRPLARFPLADGEGSSFPNTIGAGDPATGYNTTWKTVPFPDTALRMDGYGFINVGTLGTMGENLNSFRVEFWMATRCKDRPMAVLGITDSQRKQQRLCVTVNVNHAHEALPGAMRFELRDSAGHSLACSLAPSGEIKVVDGKWYRVVWAVTDAATNATFVKINGVVQDLVAGSSGSPREFIPFADFVALGAHNCRGKVEDCYDGMLRGVVLSSADGSQALWPLNEGPGALVATDVGDPDAEDAEYDAACSRATMSGQPIPERPPREGGTHHGVHLVTYTKGTPRPWKHYSNWLASEMPNEEAYMSAVEKLLTNVEMVRFAVNRVTAACISVDAAARGDGVSEELRDVRHGRVVQLQPPEPSRFRARASRYATNDTTFEHLPDEVWEEFSTAEELIDFFKETFEMCARPEEPPGHRLWVFRIGDAALSIADVAGYRLQPHARYERHTMHWAAPAATFGVDNRIAQCIGKGCAALEAVLAAVGCCPQLWLRLTPAPLPAHPWQDSALTRVLRSYSVAEADIWSHLHFLHVLAPGNQCARVELDFSTTITEVALERTHRLAAMCVQNLVRKVRARKQNKRLRKSLIDTSERRRRSVALREEHAGARAKGKRVALLIAAVCPQDPRRHCPVQPRSDVGLLKEVLYKLGYDIVLVGGGGAWESARPCTLRSVREAVAEACAGTDSMVLVYIAAAGAGGKVGWYRPPFPEEARGWLEEREAEGRAAAEAAEETERQELSAGCEAELEALRQREEGDGGSPRAKAGGKAAARQKRPSRAVPEPKPRTAEHRKSEGVVAFGRRVASPRSEGKPEKDAAGRREDELEEAAAGELAEEESAARAAIDAAWGTAQEGARVLLRERCAHSERHPSGADAPLHLLLDDTPVETSTENTLGLQELRGAVLGKWPQLGTHRMLLVDTWGTHSQGGWFFAGGAGGECVQGHYDVHTTALMSQLLVLGLWGQAQPPESPLVLAEEREVVHCAALVDFLFRRLSKKGAGYGVRIGERVSLHELIGDDFVCPKVLLSPQRRAEDKRAARAPGSQSASKVGFWAVVALNVDIEPTDDGLYKRLGSAWEKYGEGSVQVKLLQPLPYADFELRCSEQELRNPRLQSALTEQLSAFSAPHEVTVHYSDAPPMLPLPPPIASGVELNAAQDARSPRRAASPPSAEAQWYRPGRCAARVRLQGAPAPPGGDLRFTPPECADRAGCARTADFVQKTRRAVRQEWQRQRAEGGRREQDDCPPLRIGSSEQGRGADCLEWRQWCYVRAAALPEVARRVIKCLRRGDGRAEPQPAVAADCGLNSKEDEGTIDRAAAVATNRANQRAAAQRRQSAAAEAKSKAKAMKQRETAELREHIAQRAARVKANAESLTSPADLAFLFSVAEGSSVTVAAEALLAHTSPPSHDPIAPQHADGAVHRGHAFVRRLLEWKLWDVLSALVTHDDADGEALYQAAQLLIVTLDDGPRAAQQLAAHPVHGACCKALQNCADDPAAARWTTLLLALCCDQRWTAPEAAGALLELAVRAGRDCAPASDVAAAATALHAAHRALVALTDEQKSQLHDCAAARVKPAAEFALATLLWAGSAPGSGHHLAAVALGCFSVLRHLAICGPPDSRDWAASGLGAGCSPYDGAPAEGSAAAECLAAGCTAAGKDRAALTAAAATIWTLVEPEGAAGPEVQQSVREGLAAGPGALAVLCDALCEQPQADPELLAPLARALDAVCTPYGEDAGKWPAPLLGAVRPRAARLLQILPKGRNPHIDQVTTDALNGYLKAVC
eukprot:TRINITY_DN70133_c0_g1_i1.p1 TRINITY_DN70133_c0_g1~~TRINITY_DN70133_c0_g1_i1.p1  ORF type:complete len:2441 (+),score=770.82 TRINITY_DN70133_c0_g1_i1:105-7325(+)